MSSARSFRLLVVIALVALIVSVVPPISAQDAPATETVDESGRRVNFVTFYGHIFGSGLTQPMPANTEFPAGEENYGLGSGTQCGPVPGLNECDKEPDNMLIIYSTAGFVDLNTREEFTREGYTAFHNERGNTKDVFLDPSQDVKTKLFMTLDFHPWFVGSGETECPQVDPPPDIACPYPYWGWDPGHQPAWVVEAKMYSAVLGDYGGFASTPPDFSPLFPDFANARLIAEGKVGPIDVQNGIPNAPHVNEFEINMGKPQVEMIPKEESFFIVYKWWAEAGGSKYELGRWRLWGGEFFPPTFVLPVRNAFDVEMVIPQFLHEKLVLLGVVNTPWGSYDLDPASVKLAIEDSRDNLVETPSLQFIADYSVAHGGHYLPANLTWIWDYKADGLAPGTYTVTVGATNWQGSAQSSTKAKFTINRDGTPGPIEIGRSGQQTASEKDIEEFQKGAENASGREGAGPSFAADLVPLTLLGLVAVAGRRGMP